MIIRARTAATAAFLTAALVLAACGGDDGSAPDATPSSTSAPSSNGSPTGSSNGSSDGADGGTATGSNDRDSSSPVVVASTSWVAALAVAAGIADVTIVAPVDLQHPPDYDPKPSDLAAIADADFVLMAGFEGFAERLTEASGGDAELITLEVDNKPDTIRANVRSLAETFGTEDAAEAWIEEFDGRLVGWRADLDEARPDTAPTAVAHVFMAYWAELAGIEVIATYGPQPVSPSQLAEFTAADPDLVLTNAHVPAGAVFDDLDAVQVEIRNFPDDSLDLIEVFEANVDALMAAFDET